jgi:hypothetical protein
MRVCEAKDSWGQPMYWAAMTIVPLSVFRSSDGRWQHFVLGFVSGLLLTGLLRFVWLRRSPRR